MVNISLLFAELPEVEGKKDKVEQSRQKVTSQCESTLPRFHLKTKSIILSILFLAPRMVYCMIWLILKQNFVDEYDVSTSQLRVLFTYWCHVCWLRFWRDKLVVNVILIDKCLLQSRSNHTIKSQLWLQLLFKHTKK